MKTVLGFKQNFKLKYTKEGVTLQDLTQILLGEWRHMHLPTAGESLTYVYTERDEQQEGDYAEHTFTLWRGEKAAGECVCLDYDMDKYKEFIPVDADMWRMEKDPTYLMLRGLTSTMYMQEVLLTILRNEYEGKEIKLDCATVRGYGAPLGFAIDEQPAKYIPYECCASAGGRYMNNVRKVCVAVQPAMGMPVLQSSYVEVMEYPVY